MTYCHPHRTRSGVIFYWLRLGVNGYDAMAPMRHKISLL